jgi:CrcB protein
MTLLSISIFGVIGTLLRYFVGNTLIVNIVGSFFIGLVYVLAAERNILSETLRLAIVVGLLGGFTTFSSYSLEAFLQFQKGQMLLAMFYFIGTPVLCLLCTFLGVQFGRYF